MFYQERLIVGYIQDPDQNRCMFQLAGGEEKEVSRDEFTDHWRTYRQFEAEQEAQHLEHYRPLPVTLEIRRSIQVKPVNFVFRRKRRSA